MRTRTLLLLAVTCGLLILVAGTVQLLRLGGQEAASSLAVGQQGAAGDARVVVQAFTERDGVATVTVTLSGVDDPKGLSGFTLVGPGKKVTPNQRGAGVCTGFTAAPVTCALTFGTSGIDGAARVLVFSRAAEKVSWALR